MVTFFPMLNSATVSHADALSNPEQICVFSSRGRSPIVIFSIGTFSSFGIDRLWASSLVI
jgi:hypothetical protein